MNTLIWAAILVLASPRPEDESAPELTAREKELFAWFDRLGFADTKGSPFVAVTPGYWQKVGGADKRDVRVRAFLLQETGKAFRILSLDLEELTFDKDGSGDSPEQSGVFDVVNLRQEARELVEKIREDPRAEDLDQTSSLGPRLEMAARVFVLARACARNGLSAEAHALCEGAQVLLDSRRNSFSTGEPRRAGQAAGGNGRRTAEADNGKPRSLREALGVYLGHVVFWRAILAFEDLQKTRKDLLGMLRPFAERFPESERAGTAREMVAVLERMVREDETRPARQTPLSRLSKAARIERLIYELRDQGCQVFGRPGGCDIFAGGRRRNTADTENPPNPAQELADLGYDAVPRLIVALGDDHLTRAIDSFRDHFFSHRVMTVGDCAHKILERIAGWGFYLRFAEANDQDRSARKAIEKWWAAFHEKGEKQSLIDGAAAGDMASEEQARRLVERYPEAALEPIQRGLAAAKDPWVKGRLLELMGQVGGKAAGGELARELEQGALLTDRVSAARALSERGEKQKAVAAMIAEWLRLLGEPPDEEAARRPGEYYAREQLLEFLARSDSPEAIRTLGKDTAKLWLDLRRKLVEALEHSARGFLTQAAVASRPAIEELLVQLLDDREATKMMRTGGVYHPRICDLAAASLAEVWKSKYRFQPAAPVAARDRAVAAARNVWRKEHGLEAGDLPPGSLLDRDPAAAAAVLAKALGEAAAGAAARELIARVERSGPEAFLELERRRVSFPKGKEGRREIEELQEKIEALVVEAEGASGTGKEPELLATLAGLAGHPLESDSLIGLLTTFASRPRPPGTALQLLVHRPERGMPLSLVLSVEAQAFERGIRYQKPWSATLSFESNRGGGSGLGDSLDARDATKPESYFRVKKALQERFAGAAGGSLVLELKLLSTGSK